MNANSNYEQNTLWVFPHIKAVLFKDTAWSSVNKSIDLESSIPDSSQVKSFQTLLEDLKVWCHQSAIFISPQSLFDTNVNILNKDIDCKPMNREYC